MLIYDIICQHKPDTSEYRMEYFIQWWIIVFMKVVESGWQCLLRFLCHAFSAIQFCFVRSCIFFNSFSSYMLRKGTQYFPFRKAVHFFRKVKGKQDWTGKGGKERERKGMMGKNFLSFPSLISPFKKPNLAYIQRKL